MVKLLFQKFIVTAVMLPASATAFESSQGELDGGTSRAFDNPQTISTSISSSQWINESILQVSFGIQTVLSSREIEDPEDLAKENDYFANDYFIDLDAIAALNNSDLSDLNVDFLTRKLTNEGLIYVPADFPIDALVFSHLQTDIDCSNETPEAIEVSFEGNRRNLIERLGDNQGNVTDERRCVYAFYSVHLDFTRVKTLASDNNISAAQLNLSLWTQDSNTPDYSIFGLIDMKWGGTQVGNPVPSTTSSLNGNSSSAKAGCSLSAKPINASGFLFFLLLIMAIAGVSNRRSLR